MFRDFLFNKDGGLRLKKIAVILVSCILFFIIGCGSWFTVGAGQVGVTFNKVTGKTASYSQGFYFKIPLVVSVYDFDIRTQRRGTTAESSSKDLQKVDVDVVVNFHLDAKKVNTLFVEIGKDYYEVVILPAIYEAVKATTAKFAVEDIIVQREQVKRDIEAILNGKFLFYNIVLESVNLTDISFSKEFNHVVEQKQIEEQKIKTAQYQRQQAEEYKKKTILEAEAEARKQQLLSMSVTKDVIALK